MFRVMSKAEQFIKDYTNQCSNVVTAGEGKSTLYEYHEWLTPEQALRAVEIEREEMIDKACEWLGKNLSKYSELTDEDEYGNKLNEVVMNIFYGQAVNDFKNYMKGE